MGSSNSRQVRKAQQEAKLKAQRQLQEEATKFCHVFSGYMTKKGLTNFEKLTDNQISAISKIYKNIVSNNVNIMIRRAIENGKNSIEVFSYSQEGPDRQKNVDHIGNMQDHEYRLLVGYILKQKFPLIVKMKLTFNEKFTTRSEDFNHGWATRYYSICNNYVTISWDKIDIKKQDIMRCREYNSLKKSLKWSQCDTVEDIIIYERLVQLRRKQLKKNAISACIELGTSTENIETPKWDGVIPRFDDDITDFQNLGCIDYKPPVKVDVVDSSESSEVSSDSDD